MNRRELIVGAAGSVAALGGFPIPNLEGEKPTPTDVPTVWLVLCGGHCQDPDGLDELDTVERNAVRLGWEPLDRRHEVDRQSMVLVRRPMSRKAARLLEHGIIGGYWTELPVFAIWIEVPG